MKLVRYESPRGVRSGILTDRGITDIHDLVPDCSAAAGDMAALLSLGPQMLQVLRRASHEHAEHVGISQGRLLAPLVNPPKIICAWVNYPNPAVSKLPETPIFFSKYASAIIGPGDAIRLPEIASQIVVEPELAVVIGTGGRWIESARALDHVAGYTIVNDVTAFSHRLQVLLGSPGPYMMAKTFDTFAPMGPWIITSDQIADPHALMTRHWTNGDLQVESSTSRAIFKIPTLIEYLSKFFTLQPGDILLCGSPPPDVPLRFLEAGDHVRIEISGIGTLENPVIADAPRISST